MSNPIRPTFDHELHGLQDNLLRLGSMLEAALGRAIQSLTTRDVGLAQQVVADDDKINALRYEIEEECFLALATQQPTARDLRSVMAAFSMAADLERMADHAEGIATIVVRMGDEPLLKPLIDIPRMADTCRDMLRGALDAYVLRDEAKARAVARRDDVIDDLYQQVFRELLSFMLEDPHTITRALYLLFIAHNLERIGDRAVNLAERVIFITSGELKEFKGSV